jgi:hypothetical protein
MSGERVAMVFAHPGHEIVVAGLMQRHRPHILFLTAADSGGSAGRAELARQGLDLLGLPGRATFLNVSEVQSYAWALNGTAGRYREIGDQILGWLQEVRPAAVFGDAFELYNFHHDLGRALLDGALRRYGERFGLPRNYECPLVCRTDPNLMCLRFQEFAGGPFEVFRLSEPELSGKRALVDWVRQRHPEAARVAGLFPPLNQEVYRAVPPDRDYSVAPAGLRRHYDDWGRLQVLLGKHRQPLLFAEHFVPLIRALGLSPLRARRAA